MMTRIRVGRLSLVFSPILWAMLCVMFCVSVLQVGCESTPMRALRGARHYAAGSEALERNQSDQAILELERAAALIPHASEIQNHLGLAYWSGGRRASALAAFERALDLDCENQAAEGNLVGLLRSGADGAGGSLGLDSSGLAFEAAVAGKGDDDGGG
jgi:tetratricopeptide (TPR) repeat protein